MASDPLVGKCLGGVEIIEPIGQGGMGTVYKGRQTALDRVVAIKTLPAHLAANAAFVERFHREARNAARLRHPNIVEVYAVGEAEGVHYLAMEYVDGEGLDKVLAREGPLDAPRAAAILKQACGALAAAHEAGIVHRDIKPSNLLLDSHGSVRVTDFGLAKRADDASVTQTSDVLGTPLYLAPEAATGAEPCPQSDLYSLGATFYHLLAGRPPFEGKTSGELIVKHVTGEPMPLHEAAPGVDPRLARIIDRLLAKPLAERYGSAEALLRDLEALGPLRSRAQLAASEGRALIAGAPTAAMTQGRRLARQALAERLAGGQRRTRKRHIALAAGAAIVALVLALVVALPRGRRAGQALLPDVEQQNIEAREHNARVLLRSAQAAAKAKDWDEVKAQLDSLEKDCGNTQLFVANRAAIEALRKQAEAPPKEQTRPATKTEVAPPPKQKPPEELAAEGGMAKGLVAAFYAGQNFERFITAKAVPNIGFNWGPEAPMPGVPADRFSARFVGWLKVPDAGDYTFRFWRDDGARLYLDGKLVIAEWEACNKGEPATVHLDKGMHRLWVEYMEIVGMAALALHWSRGGEERVIAADAFCCETELLARMKEKPAEDPLAGLRPDGARDAHGPEVAEAGKFFHGRLRRLPEDRVELFYDWADAEQLRDWAPVGPTALAVTDGELRFGGGGSRGAAHSASFAGDVEVEGTWCVRERLGGEASCIPSLCCSPGRCYSLVLKVANQKIYKDRGTQVIGWGKAGCPDGEPHTFRFAREGASLKTWINGALQTNITDPDYTSGSVMLGSWNAQVGYKGVRIVGKLDTAWLAAHPDAAKRVAAAPLEQPKAPAPEGPGQWVSLFDGKTLDGWKVVADRGYAKHGRVEAQNGELLLGTGAPVTGIAWTRDLPSLDYEVAFEVMCLAGGNNWCNFTFPVGASGCSFCFLGIGDGLTGLDQVEGAPVTRNVTTKKMAFERNRWYRVKLRVTRAAVQAWVDDAEVVTLQLRDHAVNVYDDYWGPLRPLGVANWESTTALRNLRLRRLQAEELPAVAGADLGPMVAKATEPFDAVFHTDAPWDIEGDTWYGEKEFVDGHAYHNGWLVLRDRRLGDFVLDADVTDLGDEVGFRYGIIFRRVYDWQLMLSLTRQYKGLDLRSISEYRPQPSGAVPGVTIRAGPKRFEPQEGKPYHLRIECVGTRVRCLVDGGLVGEAEDRTLLSGEIVLYVHRAKARFANIRIRPAPEAPAEKPEEAGPLWWERAERMSADARLSARAKLQAWEDVLQRFPKAPAATLARAREQRDRWAKEVAETLGVVTERSTQLQRTVFNAHAVYEMPDGRFRLLYNAWQQGEYKDWTTLEGYGHVSIFQSYCTCLTGDSQHAFGWNYDHGEEVKVSFRARARRTYGCVLFGLPGEPHGAGIVLTVGADNNRCTTLGPVGEEPWFRTNDIVAAHQWLAHELEVARGELVYRLAGKELFRRKVDLSGLRGRRFILWSTTHPTDRHNRWETPEFLSLRIVSAAQPNWVSELRPGEPPRWVHQPDPAGWVGLSHPDSVLSTVARRDSWAAYSGRSIAMHSGPGSAWMSCQQVRGAFRDCIVAARVELLGERRGWERGSVGIVFRHKERAKYVASVFQGGGARLRRRSRSPGGHWTDNHVASSRDFDAPRGMLYLVAIIQGKRLELYCNGELALVHDGLEEGEGKVGIEAEGTALLVHDFKLRPLPTDPAYKTLYGDKAR